MLAIIRMNLNQSHSWCFTSIKLRTEPVAHYSFDWLKQMHLSGIAQLHTGYFNLASSWFSSLKLILLDFQPFTQSERFLREGNGVRFRNNLYDITAYVLSFDSDTNWSETIWRTQTNAISAISTLRVDTGFEEPQLFLCSPFGARSVEDTDGRLLPYFCLIFTSMKDHLERMGRTT